MPTIADLVHVRPEVTTGALQGIISLYALVSDEEDAFEKSADRVLSATFPSQALLNLLQRLQVSLAADSTADRKGNFICSGGYGSGKSHLLLALYHLLSNQDTAKEWLAQHQIEFSPPDDAKVILLPMNQITNPDGSSVDYLWEPIFEALGYTGFNHTGANFPAAKHIKEAVQGRHVFLIIDEIERWYMPQSQNQAQAHANLTFLQNLTEYCQAAANGVFTVITLLGIAEDIHSIINRVDAFKDDLTQAPDRRQIAIHRLIESVQAEGAAAVVDAYIEHYRMAGDLLPSDDASYREEMIKCYPFHPAAIETVFRRYSSVASLDDASYQNSRGALHLLAHVLKQVFDEGSPSSIAQADLIRVGDIALSNQRIYEGLATLDAKLVSIARNNINDSAQVDNSEALLSTVLLYSLGDPEAERRLGAEMQDLLLGVMRPESSPSGGVSVSQVQECMSGLQDSAMNLWAEENPPRWVFKADISIQAQVSRKARTEEVRKKVPKAIQDALKKLISSPVAIFPEEEIPDRRDITIVVSTDYMFEREDVLEKIYKEKEYPNGLVIVIPSGHGSILKDDADIQNFAATMIAAQEIKKEKGTSQIPEWLTEKATDRELLKALPTRYGKWLVPVLDTTTNELHFRATDVKFDKTSILSEVERRYDVRSFETYVKESVQNRGTPTVDDIRADFYRQRSYPKPVRDAKATDVPIDDAIRGLVSAAELEIIKDGDAHYICGKDPGFLQKSWTVAIPPEEHKPKFDATGTIISFLNSKKEVGATVTEIRARCQDGVKEHPGELIENSRIDDILVELIKKEQLEARSTDALPPQPLPDTLTVRAKSQTIEVDHPLTLGPLPLQSIKIAVVDEVNKSDTLSEVTVELSQTVEGSAVAENLGQVLGLQDTQVGAATQLQVHYSLTEVAVSNRDQLIQLIDALPGFGDPRVTIKLTRRSSQ